MLDVFWLLQLNFVVATYVSLVHMNTIIGSNGVTALAALNNKLFIARVQYPSPVELFVYDTTSFQLLNQLTIPGVSNAVHDLATSVHNNCLWYVSDKDIGRI
jgi:hypothetical protein